MLRLYVQIHILKNYTYAIFYRNIYIHPSYAHKTLVCRIMIGRIISTGNGFSIKYLILHSSQQSHSDDSFSIIRNRHQTSHIFRSTLFFEKSAACVLCKRHAYSSKIPINSYIQLLTCCMAIIINIIKQLVHKTVII